MTIHGMTLGEFAIRCDEAKRDWEIVFERVGFPASLTNPECINAWEWYQNCYEEWLWAYNESIRKTIKP